MLFQQLFSSYMYIEKSAGTKFVQKIARKHVGEIVPWWNIDYNEMPVTNMWNETNFILKNQQQQHSKFEFF